jgi:hypothetical protein
VIEQGGGDFPAEIVYLLEENVAQTQTPGLARRIGDLPHHSDKHERRRRRLLGPQSRRRHAL